MKHIILLFFSFVPLIAFSQCECKYKIKILQYPPNFSTEKEWDCEDEVFISQYPDSKAIEITDTFLVYSVCTDNGVTVIQTIRPNEEVDEFGFRNGYQIVSLNKNTPSEFTGLISGDCVFMKIIPFFKANRMPGDLDRPIQLEDVWMVVHQTESGNIYKVDSSCFYRLSPSDCCGD